MMKRILTIIALLSLVSACGKNNSDAKKQDAFNARVQSAPEFSEIDSDLDQLESETTELEKKYNEVQGHVLETAKFSTNDSLTASQIVIYVNENNVLIMNDKAMSKNDFLNFLDKHLPALCNPTPRLSIHNKADYDTAAWILEAIYSHGCTNVDIE